MTVDSMIHLPGRATVALRTSGPRHDADGTLLLVHGLASNARLWDGVVAASPTLRCVAVDARGHGASPDAVDGYDTATAAADLAAVVDALDTDPDGPLPRPLVAVGQSWGGNVVLTLAAHQPGVVDAVCLVDGGWIRLTGFSTFDECWAALAPPDMRGVSLEAVAGWIRTAHPTWPETGIAGTLANLVAGPDGMARNRLAREHHRSILRSLYEGDPRELYPLVKVPVLLMPAGGGPVGASALVAEAVDGLADARLRAYPQADHDIRHPSLASSVVSGSVVRTA